MERVYGNLNGLGNESFGIVCALAGYEEWECAPGFRNEAVSCF